MLYVYVSWTNNSQSPRVGCLLAEKRMVALEMSIGGGGGARLCQKYKIKPRIYLRVLTPTMDSDGGAEAAEATNNIATMILREGGSVLVAKTI